MVWREKWKGRVGVGRKQKGVNETTGKKTTAVFAFPATDSTSTQSYKHGCCRRVVMSEPGGRK